MNDVPGADFWVVEDGKIKQFNCHVSVNILLEQMGVQADFASAIKAQTVASIWSGFNTEVEVVWVVLTWGIKVGIEVFAIPSQN